MHQWRDFIATEREGQAPGDPKIMDVHRPNFLERAECEILISAPPHQPITIGGMLQHSIRDGRHVGEQLLSSRHHGLIGGVPIGSADSDIGLGPRWSQLTDSFGNHAVGPKNISLDVAVGAVTEARPARTAASSPL